jgi:hypothetical protein
MKDYNRFNRWRKAGVWDLITDAITKAYDGNIKRLTDLGTVIPTA